MGEVVELEDARTRRVGRSRATGESWRTKEEVAEHFRVHVATINRWMKRGLPYEKRFEGGAVRFLISECDDWFRTRR